MMRLKQGTAWLILGWGFVLALGYLYHLILTRQLSPSDYAVYLLVMSLLQWCEIVVINGLPYAVQRYGASFPDQVESLLLGAAKIQGVLSVAILGLSWVCAPTIAHLLRDEALLPWIRLALLDIPFAGFFHLLVSYENSQRAFDKQAFLLGGYGLFKLAVGVGFVIWTRRVSGALWANPVSALMGIGMGLALLRRRPGIPFREMGSLIRFAVPSLFYFLMLQLLLSLDLWFVQAFLGGEAVGRYGVAGLISKIPFYLFIGVSATLFPILTAVLSSRDLTKVEASIGQALQLLWMLLAPLGVVIAVRSRSLITTLFRPEFASGGPVLSVLIWAVTALAFFHLFVTILNADRRPGLSFVLVSFTVAWAVILNGFLIPRFHERGAAFAMLLANGSGLGMALILVRRRFRIHVPCQTFFRITLSALVLWPLLRILPDEGIVGLGMVGVALGVYALLLFLIGEWHWRDFIQRFKASRDTTKIMGDSSIQGKE